MIFNELPDKVFKELEMDTDYRFKKWIKFVDAVDPKGTNGYAFKGDFIYDGTVDVQVEKPRVILAGAETGSRAHHSYDYGIAILHPNGEIEDAGMRASGDTKGWAIRLRDRIAELIAALEIAAPPPDDNPLADYPDNALIVELARRGYTVHRLDLEPDPEAGKEGV